MPSHQAEVMRFYTEKKMNEQPKQAEKQPSRTPQDVELTAIKRIRGILGELPPMARQRVLAYVADRANEERWAAPAMNPTFAEPYGEALVRPAPPPLAGLAPVGRSE